MIRWTENNLIELLELGLDWDPLEYFTVKRQPDNRKLPFASERHVIVVPVGYMRHREPGRFRLPVDSYLISA